MHAYKASLFIDDPNNQWEHYFLYPPTLLNLVNAAKHDPVLAKYALADEVLEVLRDRSRVPDFTPPSLQDDKAWEDGFMAGDLTIRRIDIRENRAR
jgi:hypothetical protein